MPRPPVSNRRISYSSLMAAENVGGTSEQQRSKAFLANIIEF